MGDYDRDALNNARMATFDRSPSSDAAKAWIGAIQALTLAYEAKKHPRKRARRRADHLSFSEAVGAFAADLLRHSANEESRGFMHRSADREELTSTLVSSDNFEKLVKYWTELSLMEMTGYIDARDDFEGARVPFYRRARRFRATRFFLDLATDHGVEPQTVKNHFEVSQRHANVVQVRAAKGADQSNAGRGKLIKQNVDRYRGECDRVRHLNQLIANHEYNLSDTPIVRRVFNCGDRRGFDFNLGGRFYGASDDNWMDMPKAQRARIRIDGEETTEIDVRASHLSILYSILGKSPDRTTDPYSIEGIHREVVKKVIVTAIGSGKLPSRWPKGFKEEFEVQHGWAPQKRHKMKDITEAILKKHPVLLELKKGELDWANLQFEEAECFFTAMMSMHNEDQVPSLPIHDSLIVRVRDAGYAANCLRDAYEKRLGFRPHVDIPGVEFAYLVA
ncbi:hypothetical protein [Ruegeria lacuscaerulensis]|uniref:hypothetical protein n=1 Tax=Ruegeria lacuscaerulensis TaxID=55218 RepID=UPI00147DD252|nr:hypothetical protein [Ruegeria lacuscaerulensis]